MKPDSSTGKKRLLSADIGRFFDGFTILIKYDIIEKNSESTSGTYLFPWVAKIERRLV